MSYASQLTVKHSVSLISEDSYKQRYHYVTVTPRCALPALRFQTASVAAVLGKIHGFESLLFFGRAALLVYRRRKRDKVEQTSGASEASPADVSPKIQPTPFLLKTLRTKQKEAAG